MPQPDKYSIIAVCNSVQELEGDTQEQHQDQDDEVMSGTKVVNNEKFTLERIEDFLNDEDGSGLILMLDGGGAVGLGTSLREREGRAVMALAEFEIAFGKVDAKI